MPKWGISWIEGLADSAAVSALATMRPYQVKVDVCVVSALGHKRTLALQNGMSALPPEADMCSARAHVGFGPTADNRKKRPPFGGLSKIQSGVYRGSNPLAAKACLTVGDVRNAIRALAASTCLLSALIPATYNE
jgi:hypothetical protein